MHANAGNEFFLARGLKPKKDSIIGKISNPTSDFGVSAIMNSVRVTSTCTNIRATLFMQPNSLRPQLAMGTSSNPNSIVTEDPINFMLKKDNDFKLVASRDDMLNFSESSKLFLWIKVII